MIIQPFGNKNRGCRVGNPPGGANPSRSEKRQMV
jgi:hypothetical protein